MYNEIIQARFQNLKNAGMITGADAVGQVGNVGSGDMVRIYLRIVDGVIKDAKFKTFGSVYGLVASDILCDMLKNTRVEDALLIKSEDIVKALNGLPDNKLHVADLAQSVVADAIADYRKKLERLAAKANVKKK